MTPSKARNSFGIPFLKTGPRQLVAILNQILAALDAVRVVQGGEVTTTGTIIRPGATQATARSSAAIVPWTPLDVSALVAEVRQLRVAFVPGFVDGEAPMIDVDSELVPINDDPAPYLVVPSVNGTTHAWLKVTVDSNDMKVAYEIVLGATKTGDYVAGAGGSFYLRLTQIVVSGVGSPAGAAMAFGTPVPTQNLECGVGGGFYTFIGL